MSNLALFILKNKHLREPDLLPRPLEDFRLAVATLSLDEAAARAIAPDITLAGYLNLIAVPAYGDETSIHGRIRANMDEHLVRVDGVPVKSRSGNSYLIQPTFDAYEMYSNSLVASLAEGTTLYGDNSWWHPPSHWAEGVGLSLAEGSFRWHHLRDYFLTRLVRLGRFRLIGNVGSSLGRSTILDACTVEYEWLRGAQRVRALGLFQNTPHELNVLWRPRDNSETINIAGASFVCDGWRTE